MITLYTESDVMAALYNKLFPENGSCEPQSERRDWLVQFIDMPFTQEVIFDVRRQVYSLRAGVRDEHGGWEHHISFPTTTVSFADADNTETLVEMLRNSKRDRLLAFSGLLIAKLAERYLSEIGFWDVNEEPDEDGGIYLSAEGDTLSARVVYGRDRPDMVYVPYRLHQGELGLMLEAGEQETGRPYPDEFLKETLGGPGDAEETAPEAEEPNEDESDEDEWDADESDESEEASDWDLVPPLAKFYCDLKTINAMVARKFELTDTDLTFTVEITDMPYTMVYTPATPLVRQVTRKKFDSKEAQAADAYLLFFTRTVFGSMDLTDGAFIQHDGAVYGAGNNPLFRENMLAFLRAASWLNATLRENPIYAEYQTLDELSSGIRLTLQGDTLEAEVLTGKDRPEMLCFDISDRLYFSSLGRQAPIIPFRPYSDEMPDFSDTSEDAPLD